MPPACGAMRHLPKPFLASQEGCCKAILQVLTGKKLVPSTSCRIKSAQSTYTWNWLLNLLGLSSISAPRQATGPNLAARLQLVWGLIIEPFLRQVASSYRKTPTWAKWIRQNGWFIMENPIKINLKWMIWGYPHVRKPPNVPRWTAGPTCQGQRQTKSLLSLCLRDILLPTATKLQATPVNSTPSATAPSPTQGFTLRHLEAFSLAAKQMPDSSLEKKPHVACRWNSENSPVLDCRGAECVSPPTQEPVWS